MIGPWFWVPQGAGKTIACGFVCEKGGEEYFLHGSEHVLNHSEDYWNRPEHNLAAGNNVLLE
jgi:hypothetical protein